MYPRTEGLFLLKYKSLIHFDYLDFRFSFCSQLKYFYLMFLLLSVSGIKPEA